jgi:hypothetical protein
MLASLAKDLQNFIALSVQRSGTTAFYMVGSRRDAGVKRWGQFSDDTTNVDSFIKLSRP